MLFHRYLCGLKQAYTLPCTRHIFIFLCKEFILFYFNTKYLLALYTAPHFLLIFYQLTSERLDIKRFVLSLLNSVFTLLQHYKLNVFFHRFLLAVLNQSSL